MIAGILILGAPPYVSAKTFADAYTGKFLSSKTDGKIWYVSQKDKKRYPIDGFGDLERFKSEFKEIPYLDFQKIVPETICVEADKTAAKMYEGNILRFKDELWFVSPKSKKRALLKEGETGAIKEIALAADLKTISLIHKKDLSESLDRYSRYDQKTFKVNNRSVKAEVIEIDLGNPNMKIITDTANGSTCKSGCSSRDMIDYVIPNKAFAGVNGSYFCSGSGCSNINYYFSPIYRSNTKVLINSDQLKYWTTGPIMAFDENNKFYYFKDSREFGGVENFEKKYNVKLQAALSNKPRLIEGGMNYLIDWELDKGQATSRATRNAIGYKDNKIYLVVSYSTTVPELGEIMQKMGMEYALNLDGGSSSAFFYNDEFMVGPGRKIPNVILFAQKNSTVALK